MTRTMRSMPSVFWVVLLLAGCGQEEVAGDGGVNADAGDVVCRATQCGATCVDTDTDVRHCGACDRDCTALDGVRAGAVSCVEGACVIDGACAPDRADCDGDADTGCEADLTSAESCGACGTSCSGATPVCTMSEGEGRACSDECTAPTADLCGDECVDTLTNVAHCGACDAECVAPDNASPTCADGECGFECDAGFHLCDDACVPNESVDSCGASCTPCSAPANATATCDGTSCGFICNAGYHRCGDACVPNESVDTCGSSCTPCPAPANGTATCDGTSCGFTCNSGYMPSGGSCVPLPTIVTLTVTDSEAVEGPSNTATFRVARTGLLISPVTVHLTVDESSTATVETGGSVPVDVVFNAPATQSGRSVNVVIPADATTTTFTVRALVDSHAELDETLRLDIVSDPAYQIGASAHATMTIRGGGTNVTRNGDSLTDYAVREGSLRLALENARTVSNPVVNASTAGPIVTVEPLPLLDFEVMVNGPTSGNLIIDGGNTHRIGEVRGTVRFNRVTFRNGSSPDIAAGALLNRGHLTVDQCRFVNNHASNRGSAIYNFAADSTPVLMIEDSVFENNTGSPAISSHIADVSVRNSTFTNNPFGNIEGGYTNLGGNTPANP